MEIIGIGELIHNDDVYSVQNVCDAYTEAKNGYLKKTDNTYNYINNSNILIKPNWVKEDVNNSNAIITNSEVIRRIILDVVKYNPSSITLADAPIQGCNWDLLVKNQQSLFNIVTKYDVKIIDMRNTIYNKNGIHNYRCNKYKIVDLMHSSKLDDISTDCGNFRVTQYPPSLLNKRHHKGRHEYMIASCVLDADVIISVPKLKTHKKAGITAALKNYVGINTSKEYLPHHRRYGYPKGDCYSKVSIYKEIVERAIDKENETTSVRMKHAYKKLIGLLMRIGVRIGMDDNIEGSWHGNDTLWRTVVDLNNIVVYCDKEGIMRNTPQRKQLVITDAGIIGEGDGPLNASPKFLGLITISDNPAVMDVVHTKLLSLNPLQVPSIMNMDSIKEHDIYIHSGNKEYDVEKCINKWKIDAIPPKGWTILK